MDDSSVLPRRPDQNAPEAEADFFLAQVGALVPGDLLVLDLEAGSGDLSAWALAWLNRVSSQVGFAPLLYSGTWFLESHGCTGNADLAQYGLWLAAYQNTQPAAPSGWTSLAFWQHTDAAAVPGVGGGVDESYFLDAQLAPYGSPASPVAAAPSDPPTPDATPAAAQEQTYVVQGGDTLDAISGLFGVNLLDLEQANPSITDPNLIYAGEVLAIP